MKETTIQQLYKRSGRICENPQCSNKALEVHHIYFKSQYRMSDRNELWNIAYLCTDCHRGGRGIHNGSNTQLDKYLKELADIRKPKEQRSNQKVKDEAGKQRRKLARQRKIDSFRAMHDGLSPSQLIYKRQKEYLKSINK